MSKTRETKAKVTTWEPEPPVPCNCAKRSTGGAMKTIKVGCAMSLQGARIEDEIQVEDDATEEEIAEQVREWALQHFDWWMTA
jgi:hypothetical protein